METTVTQSNNSGSGFLRGLAWFLIVPLLTFLVVVGIAWASVRNYQSQHEGRIYSGVSVMSVDVSAMTEAEARAAVLQHVEGLGYRTITLVDPISGVEWQRTATELGVSFNIDGALTQALAVGREGDAEAQVRKQFAAWYYGLDIAAITVVDEAAFDAVLAQVSAEIDVAAIDAQLDVKGDNIDYTPAQLGRVLDKAETRTRLSQAVYSAGPAQIELTIADQLPRISGDAATNQRIQNIINNPITFYLEKPLDGLDLQRVTLPQQKLVEWLRTNYVENADGTNSYNISIDQETARLWLAEYEAQIFHEPENARFYFDDPTSELVLIAPHENGRFLDVDATLIALQAGIEQGTQAIPFVVREVVPAVNSDATGEELGVTELLSEATTWFYGSPPERMHNIARGAASFYGVMVAPGETFSFNRYLGEISEDMGYTTGLIISNGRTIEGVGGGVCQVSTTLYQSVFWSGLDLGERNQHGYRVHYYENDFEEKGGIGMDATIYSPIVDFTFTNDTEHHILIENYYDEGNQSLTFKLYSTDIGRTVEREVFVNNETDPKNDIWEFNPELAEGEIKQVDWAVGGANVVVSRRVINRWGDLRNEEAFTSNYIPWANVYEYGPGADVPDWVNNE